MLDSLRTVRGEPLLLDGGDILGHGVDGDREKGELIFDCMGKMGYRVITVGERDLNYGWEFLREQARLNGLTIVCANLFDSTGEMRLTPAYTIEQVGDLRVGIFGLLSQKSTIKEQEEEPLPQVRDPLETAKALVPLLEDECDLIVGLLHMGPPEAVRLVREVSGIDLVVVGHDPGINEDLNRVEETLMVRAGYKGQRIALIDASADPATGEIKLVPEIVILSDEIPHDAELAARVEASAKRIQDIVRHRNAERVAQTEMEKGTDRYLGHLMCQRCHLELYRHWEMTHHAEAFHTLEKNSDQRDENCLACHTTGYGLETGFEDAHAAPDLRAVQCESCHGMGTEHGPGYGAAARASCGACHTPEWSPGFDYQSAWEKIEHPPEGQLTQAVATPD